MRVERVDIIVEHPTQGIIYKKTWLMDVIPNIGEGILMPLNEPEDENSGWLDATKYCEYAKCYEKYLVVNSIGGTEYIVCKLLGETFTGFK